MGANEKREVIKSSLENNGKLIHLLKDGIPDNFLLTREEMLQRPPHILITNYTMLEHLLLLPRNAPLFATNHLRTIVLDEIHTYSGAQATEVAFLLRKLKNRLGQEKPLKVFGTSASLKSGEGVDDNLLSFASNLFGEQVEAVVRGNREIHGGLTQGEDEFSLSADEWLKMGRVLEQVVKAGKPQCADFQQWVAAEGLASSLPPLEHELLEPALEKLFAGCLEMREVAKSLMASQSVVHFVNFPQRSFPRSLWNRGPVP